MKFNKTIVFPILALIAIVTVGVFLINADREVAEQNQGQEVITPASRDELGQETDEGRVLGDNTQPREADDVLDVENLSGGKETSQQTPSSPMNQPTVVQTPTHQTVRYLSLGFELFTPIGWKHKVEQTSQGLIVTFYDAKNVYGTIEGVNGYTSIEQLEADLKTNSVYSSISRSEFNGIPALMYYSASRSGMQTAVMVKNRVYVFHGSELAKYLGNIKFL